MFLCQSFYRNKQADEPCHHRQLPRENAAGVTTNSLCYSYTCCQPLDCLFFEIKSTFIFQFLNKIKSTFRLSHWLVIFLWGSSPLLAQPATLAFVSDTQEPMWVEDLFLRSNRNVEAADLIFKEIVKQTPTQVFILGDVVALGYKEKKWKEMDARLKACRDAGIRVSALLGNHDVMMRAKKGEERFRQRFPDQVRTGFVIVTDSIAVVLLNSNFKKLSTDEAATQQAWLAATLKELDTNASVKLVITTCHHAPFSNSKVVGSSESAQEHFLPAFRQSKKAKLFMTGHSHAFEHFNKEGKDFVVIGGGGGIHQPLREGDSLKDLAPAYKPMFHFVTMTRTTRSLLLSSHFLKDDFSGFALGYQLELPLD
jgi:UDP-2,3-diacylglucosamine pyrophosphatase LpxH